MHLYQMSDSEALKLLKSADETKDPVRITFIRLAEMLGSDAAAIRALKAENEFVMKEHIIGGPELAAKLRGAMLERKLDWTCENLTRVYQTLYGPALSNNLESR